MPAPIELVHAASVGPARALVARSPRVSPRAADAKAAAKKWETLAAAKVGVIVLPWDVPRAHAPTANLHASSLHGSALDCDRCRLRIAAASAERALSTPPAFAALLRFYVAYSVPPYSVPPFSAPIQLSI